MEKLDTETLEELQQEDFNSREAELWELKYSGRNRKLQHYLRDGVKINGTLTLQNNIPLLQIGHPYDDIIGYHELWLTLEIEQFILYYLCTGKRTKIPKLYLKREDITFQADENYIYKHIKREYDRNAKIETTENEQGVRVTAKYPYGTISYGVLPHSIEQLDSILNGIESDYGIIPEYDIQKLHSDNLPIERQPIFEGKFLDSVFKDGIPPNIILDKTICGIGATHLEINTKRPSIIIEPNVPVIIGKENKHPQIIGVYGEMKIKDLKEKIEEKRGMEDITILTTPESFWKVTTALNSLEIPYREDFFLLFDECDRVIEDIDFRKDIALPMDEFFQFTNKAMVSATPIIIDDPRFAAHNFKVIKIRPNYYYAQPLELKTTNNVSLMLKRTLAKLERETETKFCIFFNYVKGITDIIEYLEIPTENVSIYCSESSCKELKKEGWKNNVFDNLNYKGDTVNLTTKYNFFTSRYYSAVDIKLDYKPVVIMVSMVYKFIPNETPFTLIEPETEALQIAGRFRNGISRLIHITDTNSEIIWKIKEDLKGFLHEQHFGYLELKKLKKNLTKRGEKYIVNQAIERTDYFKQGYVNKKDKVNYFRYNNAYLDERLKMLYSCSAMLYNAYSNSGAFYIYSESEYCVYSEQELKAIKSKNTPKAKRIQLLFEGYPKLRKSLYLEEQQLLEELKTEYSLYIEAFYYIGYRRVKQLKFLDSDVEKEVKAVKFKMALTAEEVKNDVYSIFKEGKRYSTAFINEQLEEIFVKHNICMGRKIMAKDMEFYFEAEEYRTSEERGWKLIRKLLD